MKKRLITIVGPTAIGKTALSIKLAKYCKTEILSSDSRQFFREMEIGTAKPNNEEMAGVPHHFVNSLSIHDYYSVGDFEKDFIKLTNKLFEKHDTLIMVGGSGLYVKAILYGLDEFPEVNLKIREELMDVLSKQGLSPLLVQLKELDPVFYNDTDHANSQRIVRALETCISTGKSFSSFRKGTRVKRSFESVQIGLTADREIVYDRINQRVDIMMNQGLLEEAKTLYPYKSLNALQTVGYKELFEYVDGNSSLEEAIELIKRNTRRFAKKQFTWFKKDQSVKWVDYQTSFDDILQSLGI